MTFDRNKHDRRSIRLRTWDYSKPWWYFVTICTRDRACTLGKLLNGSVVLSESGRIAEDMWGQIPDHFPNVGLDLFVVMPNHMHWIIILKGHRRGAVTSPLRKMPLTLGRVVAYFKYQSTKAINDKIGIPGARFWQRNYFEHIIRDDADLFRIREYISTNPLKWSVDDEDPQNRQQ